MWRPFFLIDEFIIRFYVTQIFFLPSILRHIAMRLFDVANNPRNYSNPRVLICLNMARTRIRFK